MTSQNVNDFVCRAEAIYDQRLRRELEQKHANEFVAIEPESGDYFLGPTLSEAIGAARRAYPQRLAHAMRIGHAAALHFGMQVR